MALHRSALGTRAAASRDLARVVLILAAVIVVFLVMTAIFGIGQAGPSYDIVPDPASGLGLPF